MALTVTLLGVSYSIPETSDVGYDTALTSYLKALATAFPQLNGGLQSLTAELDFGTSFGVKALYLKSETANPASAGQIRLAKTDTIKIRNNANGADLALGIDAGDALQWNGANVTGNPMLGASTAAAQAIVSATTTTVVFGTVELDTDSGYASGTGRYTVPAGKGGHYLLTANIGVNGTPNNAVVFAFKNAVELKRLGHYAGATVPAATQVGGSAIVNLAAGDIIDIRVSATGAWNLTGTATENYFALKRIPT